MNKRSFFKNLFAAATAAVLAPFVASGTTDRLEINHRDLNQVMRLVGNGTKRNWLPTPDSPGWVSFVVHKNLVGQYYVSLYSKQTFFVQFFICNSTGKNHEYWWPAVAGARLSGNQLYFIIKQMQQVELTGHTAPIKGFADCENHRHDLDEYLMKWGVA